MNKSLSPFFFQRKFTKNNKTNERKV